MPFFHAPSSVLTPDETGGLPDVTPLPDGTMRSYSFHDGTSLIEADAVNGGTQVRWFLDENEKPDSRVEREVIGLDRVLANLRQNVRILTRLYQREDGSMPAAAQSAVDDQTALFQKVKQRRDQRASNVQWPDDSVRKVCYDRGEDPDRLRVGR